MASAINAEDAEPIESPEQTCAINPEITTNTNPA